MQTPGRLPKHDGRPQVIAVDAAHFRFQNEAQHRMHAVTRAQVDVFRLGQKGDTIFILLSNDEGA